ncbi:glycosyltransferase family 2 protein [Herminiimonas aquatilis]|uniref:Glycosyltransferase family 2 protein n=1 Tax=Herminiimonas aquatilis TaxID=345342 RepID=A0ABW2J8J7_9BURK
MSALHFESESVPISVVIPCYCCDGTIERALDSVVLQTSLPQEVILVEDGSPDDGQTLGCLLHAQKKYAEKFAIQVISLEVNQGAAAARNRGWQASSQPYIAFLDADDAWHPSKLEYQYKYMASNPEIALTGHGYQLGAELPYRASDDVDFPINVKRITPLHLLLSNSFVTPSVMLRADISFRFRNGQRYVDDHLLWLEIVLSGLPAVKFDVPLAFVFKELYGAGGLSSNLWAMEKAELGNYWYLYRQRLIGLSAVLGVTAFSFAKYMRRLLIVGFRYLRKPSRQ